MISDTNILRNIERQPRQTAGYKQLVRELGARGNDRRELSERLRSLVSRGELVQADGDRYAIPKASRGKNQVTGRLSMHRDGYGFHSNPTASTKYSRAQKFSSSTMWLTRSRRFTITDLPS